MDRYEILEEVARGASGIIYRARDRELNRTIAIKRLKHEAPSGPAREPDPPIAACQWSFTPRRRRHSARLCWYLITEN